VALILLAAPALASCGGSDEPDFRLPPMPSPAHFVGDVLEQEGDERLELVSFTPGAA
jgi:hypothetical protein